LTTAYLDLRKISIADARTEHESRLIGIILQHQQSTEKEIVIDAYYKKTDEEKFRKFSLSPKYPTIEVPNLMQLLDRENFEELDIKRFELLKWSIGDELQDVDVAKIPITYFRTVLTLYFMVLNRFITVFEADLFLLNVKHVVLDTIPENFEYPPVVEIRAFRIVFLFLSLFGDIGRSIKTCGLKHQSVSSGSHKYPNY
jgi:hypothetical protein